MIDAAQAARLHNVLMLLFPEPALEMTAYDDYYPMLLYGLRAIPESGESVVRAVQDFRRELAALLPQDQNPAYDASAVQKLMIENVGLLQTVRLALDMPAARFNALAQGQLSLLPNRDENQSVRAHLRDNTRFDPRYHREGIDELVRVIGILEDEARLQTGIAVTPRLNLIPRS